MTQLEVETDSLKVSNLLSGQRQDLTGVTSFIAAVPSLGNVIGVVSVAHTGRRRNQTAHSVARRPCRVSDFGDEGEPGKLSK